MVTIRSFTGGSLVREEQYINPLKKNSFGPTEALCIDQQQCIHRSAAGFVVERRVYTPKVSTVNGLDLLQCSTSLMACHLGSLAAKLGIFTVKFVSYNNFKAKTHAYSNACFVFNAS